MPFAAICHDHDGDTPQQLRASELQAHLDYVDAIADRVLVAGPLTTGGSETYNASIFIYAADSEAEARQLLEDDPYYRAGIYSSVTLAPFTPARGTWL